MVRDRMTSIISILGLGIGMASCMIISLYVQQQLSFDNYHTKKDNIYRVVQHQLQAGEWYDIARSPAPLSKALQQEYPQIQEATTLVIRNHNLLESSQFKTDKLKGICTDASFSKMFDLEIIEGSLPNALLDARNIILTSSVANLFLSEGNALGNQITINNDQTYQVAGIIQDIPDNSHLTFDYILPINSLGFDLTNWNGNYCYTYLLMNEKQDRSSLDKTLENFAFEKLKWEDVRFYLQPLEQIYLHSSFDFNTDFGPRGNFQTVVLLLIIAMVILVIGSINFINFSISEAHRRSKEIGLRKVSGAFQYELIVQFLIETSLMSAVGFLIALTLTQLSFPILSTFLNITLSWPTFNLQYILLFVSIYLITVLLSGAYPALIISRFNPKDAFRLGRKTSSSSFGIQKILITGQFAISLLLIGTSLILFSQLSYLKNKDLGINKEQVLYVHLKGNLKEQYPQIKEQLLSFPEFQSVSGTFFYSMPFNWVGSTTLKNWPGKQTNETFNISQFGVDLNFIETLDLELVEGRSFMKQYISDTTNYIINETLANKLQLNNPIGMRIDPLGFGEGNVIGVVKDFHFNSLHDEIQPLIMQFEPNMIDYLLLKISPEYHEKAIEIITQTLDTFQPDFPYEVSSLNEDYKLTYATEEYAIRIIEIFCFIAVALSCVGLFGLSKQVMQVKMKEIGIRKILGAKLRQLSATLLLPYIQMVLIAFVITLPIVVWGCHTWLDQFAYTTHISPGFYLFPAVIAILLVLISVGVQTWKTAIINPAAILRDE